MKKTNLRLTIDELARGRRFLHVLAMLGWLVLNPDTAGAVGVGLDASVGDYQIHIAAERPLWATVEARIEVDGGFLTMATGGGINHLPNQWATFVQDLQVHDASGKSLTLRPQGPSGWQIEDGYTGMVTLSYGVDLSFTQEKWPPGNEQAGIWQDGALYLVTKPLFVASNTAGIRSVTFDVPEEWSISVPWEAHRGQARTFVAMTRDDLIDNSLVLGQHIHYVFEDGAFTLVLALVGDLADRSELVASTLGAVAEHITRVFPRTPSARYMLTLFYAEQDDGESFERSAAFTTATVPTQDNIMLWGNNLAHEMYHIWIGGQIRGGQGETEWFDEGFTDYYADLALVQSGTISTETFRRKMEKVMARYVYFKVAPVFPRISIAEASLKKGTNRFAVYDGGWAVAFCLDVLIREHTNGAKSLNDFMRLLYDRFALPRKEFTPPDLAAAASDVAGTDLSSFFAEYVEGTSILPLDDFLQRIGLEGNFQSYAAELWITQRNDAGPHSTFQLMTALRDK